MLQASGDTVAWVDSESPAASSETIGEMLIVTGVGVMGKIAPPSGDGTYYLRTSITSGVLTTAWISETALFNDLIPGHASAARPADLTGQAGRLYLDTR